MPQVPSNCQFSPLGFLPRTISTTTINIARIKAKLIITSEPMFCKKFALVPSPLPSAPVPYGFTWFTLTKCLCVISSAAETPIYQSENLSRFSPSKVFIT